MTQEAILEIARNTLMVTLKLSMPILLVGMIVGVLISILQAITQIQEVTLTFVPKLLAIMATLLLILPWMLSTLIAFFNQSFLQIPNITR
ncbi:MAG: flagellar biosynthesis protein FliQ [Armatimonadetes bacterium]|nr:flagellar biosynthesis protein FliQ [Armatimonadota bacterium]